MGLFSTDSFFFSNRRSSGTPEKKHIFISQNEYRRNSAHLVFYTFSTAVNFCDWKISINTIFSWYTITRVQYDCKRCFMCRNTSTTILI